MEEEEEENEENEENVEEEKAMEDGENIRISLTAGEIANHLSGQRKGQRCRG